MGLGCFIFSVAKKKKPQIEAGRKHDNVSFVMENVISITEIC